MTKAEILASIRYLVNEQSTDAGALLSDTGNLLDFAYDAAEQVVLDLIPIMPHLFLVYEDVSLVASTGSYALTKEFLQVYKVERNVTDKRPKEIPIIDPLKKQFYTKVGESDSDPLGVWFVPTGTGTPTGQTMYVWPVPSESKTNYLRVYEVVPEAAAIPTAGPTYIPRIAHRLVVYWGASLAAISVCVDPAPYLVLYQKRLTMLQKTWRDRYHQEPRFLREAVVDRMVYDDREPYFYDMDWPD